MLRAYIARHSFLKNNFADFLHEVWVKIIQILSSRWWCFVKTTTAIGIEDLSVTRVTTVKMVAECIVTKITTMMLD